jgi:hypothetical protein
MRNIFSFVWHGKFLILAVFILGVANLFAQTNDPSTTTVSTRETPATQKSTVLTPAISDLDGISIGMTADQVKEKLGKADSGDETGMYYSLNNGESMQLGLDSDGTIKMIAMIYSGKGTKAPEPSEVFGAENSVTPGSDGKIYKMVRYPSAGYWVAYSRLNLDAGPMTTITIQKIQLPK